MEQYQMNLKKVKNEKGPELCFREDSGVKLLEKDGLYFKDLAKTGELLPYEDWRLPVEERAQDLASRLSVEQIAGLMLHSAQQFVPGYNVPQLGGATYGGKSQAEAGVPVWAPTDQQKTYIGEDFMRHMLVSSV